MTPGTSAGSIDVVSCEQLRQRIEAIQDTVLRGKISRAIALLHRTFELYGRQQLALSFNGGKDSTVLLHLLRVALLSPSQGLDCRDTAANGVPGSEPQGLGGIAAFFFERSDDFAEVRQFVHRMDETYTLGVDFLSNPDFKSGLITYLQEHQVVAIVLGTRRGDPNAEGQEHFCPSSAGWPPFMRINPILDWTYHDVWTFLKATQVPYCSLYDCGYTSLGGVHNTLPNSALELEDGTFGPAHSLLDGRLERSGRVTKQRRKDSFTPRKGHSTLTWSAGIVVVGDEILSGKVADVNAPFLCQELRALGWQVRKVVVVPDDVAAIASEVSSMSQELEVVITSGGVGPTLDDVTMEGVAQAMGKPLVRNPVFEERLLRYFGDGTTDAHLKMADTPEDETQLIDYTMDNGQASPFPLVQCRNVFVLPGVPHLLQQKWRAVRLQLEKQVHLNPFSNRVLRLDVADEAAIAPLLEQVAMEYGSEVTLGSYPVTEQSDGARILVTLESKHSCQLDAALQRMGELLPGGTVLSTEANVQSLASGGSC